MPNYEFKCIWCEVNNFVVKLSVEDRNAGVCPECAKPALRVFSPVPVHYKGTGFYSTDYRNRKP